jgi:hypothetical protein
MSDFAEAVKRKVMLILSMEHGLNKILSNSLIVLLKIRRTGNYLVESLGVHNAMMLAIESNLNSDFQKPVGIMHEIMNLGSQVAMFGDLTDDEEKELYEFFTGLNPEKADSLKVFMMESLGIKSPQEMRSPDLFLGDKRKSIAATWAARASGDKESFILKPQRDVTNKELENIIREYYTNRGYEVKESRHCYMVTKDETDMNVVVTNDPGIIMVVVSGGH